MPAEAAFTLDGTNIQMKADEDAVHVQFELDPEGIYLHPNSARLVAQALLLLADDVEGKND